jgi:hypothetical protein
MSKIEVIDVTPKKATDLDKPWWSRTKGTLHEGITPVINSIQQNQSYRRNDNLRYARPVSYTHLRAHETN